MSNYVIEVKGLKKHFGSNKVLEDVNLKIEPGESYVIIGASGSGKSVLIKCILGLIEPDAGTIMLNGKNLGEMNTEERLHALLKCGVLFQGGALFDSLNVVENVSFGLVYGYGMSPADTKKIAYEKIRAVNLDPDKIASQFPAELSGGMKKRVALARAIAVSPSIIFFDEPTTGLDPITSGTINELIVQSTKNQGISALSITHDLHSLRYISDRVGLLQNGKIIWEGTKDELETTDNPYIVQFRTGSPVGPFLT